MRHEVLPSICTVVSQVKEVANEMVGWMVATKVPIGRKLNIPEITSIPELLWQHPSFLRRILIRIVCSLPSLLCADGFLILALVRVRAQIRRCLANFECSCCCHCDCSSCCQYCDCSSCCRSCCQCHRKEALISLDCGLCVSLYESLQLCSCIHSLLDIPMLIPEPEGLVATCCMPRNVGIICSDFAANFASACGCMQDSSAARCVKILYGSSARLSRRDIDF